MRRISTLPDVQSLKAFASRVSLLWKLTGCAPPQLGDKQKIILDIRETGDRTHKTREENSQKDSERRLQRPQLFSRPSGSQFP